MCPAVTSQIGGHSRVVSHSESTELTTEGRGGVQEAESLNITPHTAGYQSSHEGNKRLGGFPNISNLHLISGGEAGHAVIVTSSSGGGKKLTAVQHEHLLHG